MGCSLPGTFLGEFSDFSRRMAESAIFNWAFAESCKRETGIHMEPPPRFRIRADSERFLLGSFCVLKTTLLDHPDYGPAFVVLAFLVFLLEVFFSEALLSLCDSREI